MRNDRPVRVSEAVTLRESVVQAVETWQTAPKARKAALLSEYEGLGPTPEEEAILRLVAAFVPENEWVCLCVIAKGIRERAVHQHLAGEAEAQIQGAEAYLDLTDKDYLHWPWSTLDAAIGGMAPGTLHYIVCPSKGGKTTLCRSAVAEWCKQGKKVLYGGFEMKAETLRTMYAADDCGLDPGDVLTGAWLGFDNYEALRDRMKAAYREQRRADHWYQNLRFTSYERVGPAEITGMMEMAHEWGADATVIDHIDHVGGTPGKNEFGVSVETNHRVLELTQKFGLKTIITSQTNQTGKAQDRFRDHKALRDEVVRFGDAKKQVATTMFGFYRPLRPGVTKEEREMVEYGEKPLTDLLLTHANRFNIIASRTYGSRIGTTGVVGWERGRIVEPSQGLLNEIESARHAIRTKRD